MNKEIMETEIELLSRFRNGDVEAFALLVEPLRQQLFGFIYRMIAERETVEDLAQETLLRAIRSIVRFRREARFKTWLFGIATNVCLDFLRHKSRWRTQAQLIGEVETDDDPAQIEELENIFADPHFRFEVREHIAFCFSCIGRTLAPDEQAAILLREIIGLSNEESARAMEISEPVLRHKLQSARQKMIEIYEGMCALINKKGVCNQCRSLREFAPDEKRGENFVQITVRRGVEITPENLFDERLKIVREADLENGASANLHEIFFSELTAQEDSRT